MQVNKEANGQLTQTVSAALQDEGREVSPRLAEGQWSTASVSRLVCCLPCPTQSPMTMPPRSSSLNRVIVNIDLLRSGLKHVI